MQSSEIRSRFIQFFESRGHSFVPSSPVVPTDDPTLLFANAGMNQFKSIFLGQKDPDVPRAVNSQKCIRAGGKHNDLEEVGKDGYHHTFFEMLGNWSFGDYYKKEAITWAWELLTQVYGLPKEKLYATVYKTDQEAYDLWLTQTDIDPSHISYHDEKDNFWEMGDTGPCGPCSEIHFDRGEDSCDKLGAEGHVCCVNGDCSRYIELWNLVFIQYNRAEDGSLSPLKHQYVDTGAGLERICQVLQNKSSNYDTDLFHPLIQEIARLSQVAYSDAEGISHRVIADHLRSLCFALADGGFPSNEGRGYVLRRILRRAARHGRLLGFREPFLWKLVDTLIQQMGDHFTELNGKAAFIKMVLKAEEERFNRSLDNGLQKFEEFAANSTGTLSGQDAFMLYDTYGFPLDLTQILAEEQGMKVDVEAFELEMEKQRQRARAASKFKLDTKSMDWFELCECNDTQFVGYDNLTSDAKICRYSIADDGKISIVLDQTPFYAESGGQVADTGSLVSESFEIKIDDVKKIDDLVVHIGSIVKGTISSPDVQAIVTQSRRRDTARNHTATHLLHKALQEVLGDSVQQKGSLVSPDHLRFDFAYMQAMTKEQIDEVEQKVNEIVLENRAVQTTLMDLDEAKAGGAMALFGEKYAAQVRVVSVDSYSKELCGGTHVSHTGEIGFFKIISESSSAAGIRRIEAVTGRSAYRYINEHLDLLATISHMLAGNPQNVLSKLEALQEKIGYQDNQIKQLKDQLIGSSLDSLMNQKVAVRDIQLMATKLEQDADLRSYGDLLSPKLKNTIAILFAPKADSVSILAVVSADLAKRFHAGKIIQRVAGELGGKGGGRPDTAMGGGKDPQAVDPLISRLPQLMEEFF